MLVFTIVPLCTAAVIKLFLYEACTVRFSPAVKSLYFM